MTIRDLLQRLAAEGLVAPELADPESPAAELARRALTRTSPAALRVQQAGMSLSLWIGVALLSAFLTAMEIDEAPLLCVALGVASLWFGALLARAAPTLVEVQMMWIFVLGGLSMFGIAAEGLDLSGAAGWSIALTLGVATLVAVPDLWVGLLAVLGAAGALLGFFDELGVGPLGHVLLALSFGAVTALLWVHQAAAGALLGRLWAPLAHALPLALFGPLLVLLASPPDPTGEALLGLGFTALSAWLIGRAGAEEPALAGRPQQLAWAALALAALAGHRAPGLAAGTMLLVLSHLRRSPGLQATALASVGGFLFFWYYSLDTPLLTKSVAAIGHGLAFLLAAGLLRRGSGRARETEVRPLASRISDLRWLALALGLGLAIPGWQVYQKERVLADGAPVLLRLRPVDPRSLMQGDYMRLAYAIGDEVPDLDALPSRGTLVVRLDAAGVAHYVRLDTGGPLGPGELRLDYRVQDGRLVLAADSYFFPEGQAERFESAAYGELAVAPDGDAVLVGLRDAERRRLRAQ